jgi:hypothetical protein
VFTIAIAISSILKRTYKDLDMGGLGSLTYFRAGIIDQRTCEVSIMWRRCLLALSPLVFVGQVGAQTSYPMITHVTPVVVQRGQTTTVTVSGRMDFAGARQAIFGGEGVEAQVLPGPAKGTVTRVKMKVKVADDATPGVREFRLIASAGVSSVGQLVVGQDPVVAEAGDNDTREKAQPITLPCAISGRLERAEDVDFFKFRARAGQTATFEVLGARISPPTTMPVSPTRCSPTPSRAMATITFRCATRSTMATPAGSTPCSPLIALTSPRSTRWRATPDRTSASSRSARRRSGRRRPISMSPPRPGSTA